MNVLVRFSDGTVLGSYELEGDELRLRPSDETTIWGRQGAKLHEHIEHMKALRSGNVNWDGGALRLDDGTLCTDEIMLKLGWRKTSGGWAIP